MQKIDLTSSQLYDVVSENRYKIENGYGHFIFDELSLIEKTALDYGFSVDKKKVVAIIKELSANAAGNISIEKQYDGAVVLIRGSYSISSHFSLQTEIGFIEGTMFVYQETCTSEFHKKVARLLVEQKAVQLFPGTDEEYLYEVLSDMTDSYLFETLKRLTPGLPIFEVVFDSDGTFNITETEKVPLTKDENHTEPDENTAN